MPDEFKLQQDTTRAARAEAILKNELLLEAYEEIERSLVAAWIASNPRDTDGRERCWAAVHANRKHKNYLISVVNNGKLAAVELKQLAETSERKRRF